MPCGCIQARQHPQHHALIASMRCPIAPGTPDSDASGPGGDLAQARRRGVHCRMRCMVCTPSGWRCGQAHSAAHAADCHKAHSEQTGAPHPRKHTGRKSAGARPLPLLVLFQGVSTAMFAALCQGSAASTPSVALNECDSWTSLPARESTIVARKPRPCYTAVWPQHTS